MTNKGIFYGCIWTGAVVAAISQIEPCCEGEHDEDVQEISSVNPESVSGNQPVDVDTAIYTEPLLFDGLSPCTRQKIYIVRYDSRGTPIERIRAISESDYPKEQDGEIIRIIRKGW